MKASFHDFDREPPLALDGLNSDVVKGQEEEVVPVMPESYVLKPERLERTFFRACLSGCALQVKKLKTEIAKKLKRLPCDLRL